MKKILIAVASPAGGVGKSTVSKELACIYAKTRIEGTPLRTCIVDANISFGSQRILFGIGKTKYDITDWITEYRENIRNFGFGALDSIYTWDMFQKYLTYESSRNVYIMPAPEGSSTLSVDLSEADMLFRMLMKFFDVVIVDTANDASSFTNAAILLSSYTAFIVVDDERSVSKTIQMRRVLNSIGCGDRLKENCGIIYNMYRERRHRYLEKNDIEERIKLPVIGTIPFYGDLWTYNNRLVTVAAHDTPASAALNEIAAFLVPEAGISAPELTFTEKLLKVFKRG